MYSYTSVQMCLFVCVLCRLYCAMLSLIEISVYVYIRICIHTVVLMYEVCVMYIHTYVCVIQYVHYPGIYVCLSSMYSVQRLS